MLLRCTCCHRWTVEVINLDGRQRYKVLFMDAMPKYLWTIHEVRAWVGDDVYASLEPEPDDGGCE